MKLLWHKALITVGAVLTITVACIRIASPEVLGIGYPDNVHKPPLSYRIKWLLGNKPNYTAEKKLADGTIV
jgi:hypothetical protein